MTAAAVQVDRLTFTFSGRERPSLRDISCDIVEGSWTVVAGGTGSGKSTLLRALAGLIPRHPPGTMSGSVRLFGQEAREATPAVLARTVGLVLQSPDDQICSTRVENEVAFGLENLATPVDEIGPRVRAALTAVGIESLANQLTAELSGGQKQRLVLASILVLAPRVILLDEPLSQLEAESVPALMTELDRVRAQGTTVIIAEHRLADLLPQCDQVLVLDDGRLAYHGRPNADGMVAAFAAAGLELPTLRRVSPGWRSPGPSAIAPGRGVSGDRAPWSLRVKGLAFRYPAAVEFLWRDITFDLHLGERVALVGPNGSGKSTLFGVIAGLLKAQRGSVEIVEAKPGGHPLGLVFQQPDLMLFARTVRDELAYGPRQLGLAEPQIEDRVTRVARQFELTDPLAEAPQALSHGQRLRVAVAATLTLEPHILLLDEPTAGLDRRQIERLMQAVDPRRQESGGPQHTVIYSTHDLRTVDRYADRVLVLEGGALVIDEPASSTVENSS